MGAGNSGFLSLLILTTSAFSFYNISLFCNYITQMAHVQFMIYFNSKIPYSWIAAKKGIPHPVPVHLIIVIFFCLSAKESN